MGPLGVENAQRVTPRTHCFKRHLTPMLGDIGVDGLDTQVHRRIRLRIPVRQENFCLKPLKRSTAIDFYVTLVTNPLPGRWHTPSSKRCLFLETADLRRSPCIPP